MWKINFFNDKVEKEIMQWPPKLKARLIRIVDLIKEYGPNLGMPLTKAMGNG